ncbi:MAG: site-2 protease family protein [Candidatus Micrarchaeia archaeon]
MQLDSICKNESCKLAGIVIISFLIFFLIVTSNISAFLKGILSIAILLITGILIRKITGADGWSGFLMLKIKEGLDFIRWSNRFFGKWMDGIADFGLVFGFGLISTKLFRHVKMNTIIIGLITLVVFSLFISPFITVIALSVIDLPQTEIPDSSSSQFSILSILSFAVLLIFGFAGFVALGLIAKAASVIYSIISFLLGITPKIDSSPGVSFIIPGITIPLFEGIIALLLLLVIHEGAHGIEAIRSKVRLKSSGLLLFGFIPVGAFVDIDDNQLSKRHSKEKLRVAAAGAASNIVATIIFFIPTILLLFSLPTFYSNHVIVIGVSKNVTDLSVGTEIYSINGIQINSLNDFNSIKKTFMPHSNVTLETNNGIINVKTDEKGAIGILVSPTIKSEYWWIKSIYLIFALLTVLNFFVGVINLLPVQAFDGHRILQDSIKDKKVVDLIAYIVLFALIMNIVPWIWS